MIKASLDLGSNTSLLLIASFFNDNLNASPEILEDVLHFTRLAEGLKHREEISDQALKRQEDFFKQARSLIQSHQVSQIKCVATATARLAKNSKKLISLGEKYGFSVEILSAKEEANITRKGALFQLSVDPLKALVLDIGGASTEISWKDNDFFSWPIGSVNLTEKFIHRDPPLKEEMDQLFEEIASHVSLPFSSLFSEAKIMVATAGTPTTIACLEKQTNDCSQVHGDDLSLSRIEFWWDRLSHLSKDERLLLPGMPSHRADVILAGLGLLKYVMNEYQCERCIVSTTGLRYGLLFWGA